MSRPVNWRAAQVPRGRTAIHASPSVHPATARRRAAVLGRRRRSGGRGSAAGGPARPRRRAGAGRAPTDAAACTRRSSARVPAPASTSAARMACPGASAASPHQAARRASQVDELRTRRASRLGAARDRARHRRPAAPRSPAIRAAGVTRITTGPSTCSTVGASMRARARLAPHEHVGGLHRHGSPARPRNCSSRRPPRSAPRRCPARRRRHAAERRPCGNVRNVTAEGRDRRPVADRPRLDPAASRSARASGGHGRRARVALAVRTDEVERRSPRATAPAPSVRSAPRGSRSACARSTPVAARVGEEARPPLERRPTRAAPDQVDLDLGLVGARQQRPRDALVEVAVGDRVAARPRARLLEQQEAPRGRGRRGEILASARRERSRGVRSREERKHARQHERARPHPVEVDPRLAQHRHPSRS